jgi:hypothetical protein
VADPLLDESELPPNTLQRFAGSLKRRRRTIAEKRRIIEKTFVEGGVRRTRDVAHAINANQVF